MKRYVMLNSLAAQVFKTNLTSWPSFQTTTLNRSKIFPLSVMTPTRPKTSQQNNDLFRFCVNFHPWGLLGGEGTGGGEGADAVVCTTNWKNTRLRKTTMSASRSSRCGHCDTLLLFGLTDTNTVLVITFLQMAKWRINSKSDLRLRIVERVECSVRHDGSEAYSDRRKLTPEMGLVLYRRWSLGRKLTRNWPSGHEFHI